MIATIGPASQDVETLVRLLEGGVTCCRVDLTVRSICLISLIDQQPRDLPVTDYDAQKRKAGIEAKGPDHAGALR